MTDTIGQMHLNFLLVVIWETMFLLHRVWECEAVDAFLRYKSGDIAWSCRTRSTIAWHCRTCSHCVSTCNIIHVEKPRRSELICSLSNCCCKDITVWSGMSWHAYKFFSSMHSLAPNIIWVRMFRPNPVFLCSSVVAGQVFLFFHSGGITLDY